jgi:lysyl endopeptidase
MKTDRWFVEFLCLGLLLVLPVRAAPETVRDGQSLPVAWLMQGGQQSSEEEFRSPARTQSPFGLVITPLALDVCAPADATYGIAVTQETPGYVDPVTLVTAGQPAGTTVGFSQNPVFPPGASLLTVGNTGAAPAGSYDIVVTGIAPTATVSTTVGLNLFTGTPGQPSPIAPPDGATGVSITPSFSWTAVTQGHEYLLDVATDAGFSNVVYSAAVAVPGHTVEIPLDTNTLYYWLVQASNACGAGSYSDTYHFRTVEAVFHYIYLPEVTRDTAP